MQTSTQTKRVWDPVVRLFHWSLVLGMGAAWITSSIRDDTHQWIGLAIGGLLAVRILWGFIGTHYARFSQFIRKPSTSIAYLFEILKGSEQRYLGHNPAGALMILCLLAAILATVATGWLMTTDAYYGDDAMQELHSLCAYSVIGLAILHIFGVVMASRHHRENLVAAMFTGKKRGPAPGDID
ncbi:MAG: cytochrome b/b6 domain-containing protein [Aestuariivirga sp.]